MKAFWLIDENRNIMTNVNAIETIWQEDKTVYVYYVSGYKQSHTYDSIEERQEEFKGWIDLISEGVKNGKDS